MEEIGTNLQLIAYTVSTAIGIVAFWFNMRTKVASLEQKITVLEHTIETMKVDRDKYEERAKTETSYLRDRIEAMDRNVVKISTELEIHNAHLATMLSLLIKRIDKIEEEE